VGGVENELEEPRTEYVELRREELVELQEQLESAGVVGE
jgi:hypothetical protein